MTGLPTIHKLLREIKTYNPNFDKKKVLRAYHFAERAHLGQKRKSGEDYIYHPLQAAINLTSYKVDEDTIIAALLHDVPEDTGVPLSLIKKQFGEEVYFLVKGITKLSKVYYRNNMAERQVESLKKLLIHSAKDLRVILIKLTDRLHNMETIHFIDKEEKKIRISRETLEIYVPIANLLGLWELKSQLEDLCFKAIYPDEYEQLHLKISAQQKNAKIYTQRTINKIKSIAQKNNVQLIDVKGRHKSAFSIYKKLQRKNYNIKSIYDLIGIRIICKKNDDCYKMLGYIHNTFTPKPYRLKDYIALPKPNGYQSIHTTVFGYKGIPTEFQIRTEKMHIEAEYGIAAHYFYKSSGNTKQDEINKSKKQWTNRILELKKQFNDPNTKVIDQLRLDIFQDRIFVFTPKGDVIDLPKNATCIDFAYAIHSHIGNKAYKAEVNEYEVDINTPLQSGDTVSIITHKEQRPKSSWLDYAKTSFAKRKIKEAIKKESKEMQILMGQERLGKEIYLTQNTSLDSLPKSIIKKLLQLSNTKTLDALFLNIGEGKLSPKDLIEKAYGRNLSSDNNSKKSYIVGFEVHCINRVAIFNDALNVFSDLNIDLNSAHGKTIKGQSSGILTFYAKVDRLEQIRQVYQKILNVPGVNEVKRITPNKTIIVSFSLLSIFALWIIHPIILKNHILPIINHKSLLYLLLPYSSLLIIYIFTIANEMLFRMTIPEKSQHPKIWMASIILSILGLATAVTEIIIFDLPITKLLFGLGVVVLYARLYTIYKKERKRIESF